MPDSQTALPPEGPSAFIGQPPNNARDYFIVKGLLRLTGMKDTDPNLGYVLAARPPPAYQHESRAAGVQVGLALVMLAIIFPTTLRISMRARKNQMRFGWDDWAIIAAAVR